MTQDFLKNCADNNPTETQEWCDALRAVLKHEGPDRTHFLLKQLANVAASNGVSLCTTTDYVNTIAPEDQLAYPGNVDIERNIRRAIRWNAIMMVLHSGHKLPEVGGHLGTYASAAYLYEVGFQHCFKAKSDQHGGDFLFIQGHSSPGIYARAFLEGRLSCDQLEHFRQEVKHKGLSSYPHPWLMPDFWQFATVSMGLGPLQAIYQARFLKYLQNRSLAQTEQRKVWAFLGDGECDEVESLGALAFAAREGLNNLIFVINCNLQRLDGPVQGNGKVIQSLEGVFRGAGWNVIKVVWDSQWDDLLARDHSGRLKQLLNETLDGDYLNFRACRSGSFIRENFFGKYPETLALVKDMSDEQLLNLQRGGHDVAKIYNAYQAAMNHEGCPSVVLAKTVKGYGLGQNTGLNIIHNLKKLDLEALKALRDFLHIPLDDQQVANHSLYQFDKDGPETQYLHYHRQQLGGYLPKRSYSHKALPTPTLSTFDALLQGSGERTMSTTMAFVRILGLLLKDAAIGKHIVPIVPDESRTFGMEGLFKQIGIYSPVGQRYRPTDADQMMSYHESTSGQLLEEGINEAGAMSSWMAAATSYANNDVPMIPFYIFYSMFGFQRIGDLCWAAGDMRAKGFLLGATAGRTTLAGEGLQHQDGHNLLLAATIPNCIAYDPCYAYELAVIVQDGIRRMMVDDESIYYYLTVMNENYCQPAMPKGAEDGILKGLYLFKASQSTAKLKVQLMGSGTILREVEKAAALLESDYGVAADVWSATSFNELRRDGLANERWNLFHPKETPRDSYVTQCLKNHAGPVIAATDYMKAYADQIRQWVPRRYTVLGTDGYGRSDGRVALRDFFEVDHRYIVLAALKTLADDGELSHDKVKKALIQLGLDAEKADPLTV